MTDTALSALTDFDGFFHRVTGHQRHAWQDELAADPVCRSRLIRIPTGLGKTLGVMAAWLYNRVERGDASWPRRLVWCLPMRVLVEQTEAEARKFVDALGCLWDGRPDTHGGKVGVHVLMGGTDAGDWHLYPEECAVLIGTQDMLLSRALNRGYASPRARWPMEFGMLNSDALWVMDEVQLMDVGLATSAQLQQFRMDAQFKGLPPCHTWWMSATLQPDWLESVDTRAMVDALRSSQVAIPAAARKEGLFTVPKSCAVRHDITDAKGWAKLAWDEHQASTGGEHGRITLVVANTVKLACSLHTEIAKLKAGTKGTGVDLFLVHSRFRSQERAAWRKSFLSREACQRRVNRIIVATQVVEAGVDISATTLITELAPWPNLVQRFGRAARYGGEANVMVIDRNLTEKTALPYRLEDLTAAAQALRQLKDVSLGTLEAFEEQHPELLATLYPYEPLHLLLRRELDELFDTTADLTGADLDISRFIRSGDERDVLVFWRDIPAKTAPSADLQPVREELCPVAFLDARDWLKGEKRAWVWDYLDGTWRTCRTDDIYPGQTILVDAAVGGYHRDKGWTGNAADRPPLVPAPATQAVADHADAAAESETLSQTAWQTILSHDHQVAESASALAAALALPEPAGRVLPLAARWHDVGKAHPAFVACIRSDAPGHPGRSDIAKAPKEAWRPLAALYRISDRDRRPGFRHELASVLALFGVLERHNPLHDALLGPCQELLRALGYPIPEPPANSAPTPAEHEVLELSGAAFDLLAYLVCAHHGKVRCAWHAAPRDQDYRDPDGNGLPLRGVRAGDRLPAILLADSAGNTGLLPETTLHMEPARIGLSPRTGASWTERVAGLRRAYGPFALAYLEAILRAADIRVSREVTL